MATSKTRIELIVEAEVKKAIDNLNKTEKEIDDLAKSGEKAGGLFGGMGKVLAGAFSVAALLQIGRTAFDLAKLGAEAEDVGRAFQRIPQSTELLVDLRQGVQATVPDLELMRGAIQGIDLGATNEQLKTFAEFARLESVRKGVDTLTIFQNILGGVFRGSTELLDNFGLSLGQVNAKIEELARASGTSAEKLSAVERRALLAEAVMGLMRDRMSEVGEVTTTASERIRANAAEWENLKVRVGRFLSETGEGLTGAFGSIISVANDFIDIIEDENQKINQQRYEFNGLINELIRYNEKARLSTDETERRKEIIRILNAEYPDYIKNINLEKTKNTELKTILEKVNDELELRIAIRASEEQVAENLTKVVKAERDLQTAIREQAKAKEIAATASRKFIDEESGIEPIINMQKTAVLEFLESVGRKGNLTENVTANQLNRELQLTQESYLFRAQLLDQDVVKFQETRDQQLKIYQQFLNELKTLSLRQAGIGGEGGTGGGNGGKKELTDEEKKRQQEIAQQVRKLRVEELVLSASTEFQARMIALEEQYKLEQEQFQGNAEALEQLERVYVLRRREIQQEIVDFNVAILEERVRQEDEILLQQIEREEKQRQEKIEKERQMLEQRVQVYRGVATQIEGSMARFASSIPSGAVKAAAAWEQFFHDLKRAINEFLASRAAKQFLKFIGNVVGGAVGVPGLGNLLFAQQGAYIRGSAAGQAVIVGERNTDEVILPVKKIPAFLAGEYKLPGGYSIADIPLPGPGAGLGGMGGGGSLERLVEKEVAIMGKIQVEAVAPELVRVREYHVRINREVNIPDRDMVETLLRAGKSEFD